MATENNIKNKKNQKEISLNNNKNDEQSKKVLEEFKEKVQKIIKNPFNFIIYYKISKATKDYLLKYKDLTNIGNTISKIVKDNPDSADNIINGFTRGCISAGKKPTDISDKIFKIIQGNPDSAGDIVYGFTQGCISQKKDLTDIGNVISTIIQTDGIKNNPDLVSDIIDGFTQGCILQGKKLKNIGNTISNIVQDNQDSANNIVCSFTMGCILKGKKLKNIGNTISEIVKGNPGSANNIVDGFTQGCILKGKKLKNIGNTISTIINTNGIKNNQNLVFNVVAGFTQGCIPTEKDLTEIGDIIPKIIKYNPDSAFNIAYIFAQGCILAGWDLKNIGNAISTIISTNEIKGNQDLVFNVINGFVQGCLIKKPDNIKDITESFSNSLNGMEDKTKEKLKPIFSLIVSKYFMNTLTNSGNEQLTGDNKKETDTEKKLREYYNKLFHERDNKKIESFKDIPLKELSDLQDKHLKEKFKKKNRVNGGIDCETFLKMACNLILKSEGNEELTVTDLKDKKDIFKDLKFIDLHNREDITSKEQLFHEIGLGQKDFGTDKKGSDFSIVHCSYLKHGFVMIIDKTKEWKDAIKSETESIYLIDSSRRIEDRKTNKDTQLNKKEQIFKNTPTLNIHKYQKNGTCWLNAMSAVGFLLEKQQVKKPYGLSIVELLKGFGKKRDDESGKIIESSNTSQEKPSSSEQDICDITKSTTPPEKLSSFEQGICDYSTEHFYTLTNISDKERDIIKKFLAEQVEKNKADQKTLSTASSRLEESKEEQGKTSEEEISKISSELGELNDKNFIIEHNYLKESLERFTRDKKKLKELRAKLEPKQKENSSNKKRKYNIFSSCIPDNKEGQNPQNIKKQNETCCTIF